DAVFTLLSDVPKPSPADSDELGHLSEHFLRVARAAGLRTVNLPRRSSQNCNILRLSFAVVPVRADVLARSAPVQEGNASVRINPRSCSPLPERPAAASAFGRCLTPWTWSSWPALSCSGWSRA